MDGHMGACLFLQLLNGFIGNLPGAGRGFGWVLSWVALIWQGRSSATPCSLWSSKERNSASS